MKLFLIAAALSGIATIAYAGSCTTRCHMDYFGNWICNQQCW